MSFVDNNHIPIFGECFGCSDISSHQRQWAYEHLPRGKTIPFDEIGICRYIEVKVEAADHLHKPLMHKVIGHQNKDSLHAMQSDQTMQYQTCFDGFTEPDFIGKQNARQCVLSSLLCNMQLMWQQVSTRAQQTIVRAAT